MAKSLKSPKPRGGLYGPGTFPGPLSFCALPLTDAGSVEVGYGPVCAKHWGLPHTPKGTPTVSPAAAPVDPYTPGTWTGD